MISLIKTEELDRVYYELNIYVCIVVLLFELATRVFL